MDFSRRSNPFIRFVRRLSIDDRRFQRRRFFPNNSNWLLPKSYLEMERRVFGISHSLLFGLAFCLRRFSLCADDSSGFGSECGAWELEAYGAAIRRDDRDGSRIQIEELLQN